MRKNLLWISLMILLIFSLLSVNMIGITGAQVDHDIAVVSVTPSPTSVVVGELVNITIVVENQGTSSETFNVTVYYDNTGIKTETVPNLAAGTNTSSTFTWNTTNTREEIYATDKKQKNYTINATASTVPGETDTSDNTFLSPSVVTIKSHYIAVVPQSIVDLDLTPGKNFTISIYTDYNGTDIWGWQFSLSYNPIVLNGVNVTNGDLITTEKDPDAYFIAGIFNNTKGTLSQTAAFFYYAPPTKPKPATTSGPGTLAYVTFTVVGTGDSYISLGPMDRLKGYNATTEEFDNIIDERTPSSNHLLHGYFRNTEELVTHDIAVINVMPYPTLVEKGEPVNITVVVENQGTVAERFDVDVYYDYTQPGVNRIETKTDATLAAGANMSLTFVWNTTDVRPGNHTITALAEILPDETDTKDNKRTSYEIVTVKAHEVHPLPILLIIGIVVVVVIALIVVSAIRRRKKPTPE